MNLIEAERRLVALKDELGNDSYVSLSVTLSIYGGSKRRDVEYSISACDARAGGRNLEASVIAVEAMARAKVAAETSLEEAGMPAVGN